MLPPGPASLRWPPGGGGKISTRGCEASTQRYTGPRGPLVRARCRPHRPQHRARPVRRTLPAPHRGDLAAWFFAYYVNHRITAWLPSLYTKDFGLDLGAALRFTPLSNITGLLGCLIVALVIDRVGRRPALAVGMGGAAAALIPLALSGAVSGGQVAVWASVATLFVYATNVSLYLYTPELYPTRSRALGASFGGVWHRLGVIIGPVVVGADIGAGGGLVTVFTVLGCVAAAGAVTALFAVETKGRTLEQLND
ncbi:MFS transporter [Actinomadura rugatobispora]|uniref:MFS transporter n=1 Tax=Actinomadura rugatobispora TaxID=1994 RepID=A0ABW1AFY6_9ACTN|nr:hypothetical protein GCM10010200_112910 [Actinomadura rugatobispora]